MAMEEDAGTVFLAATCNLRETYFAMKNSTLDEKMPMTMFVSGDTTIQAMANPAIDDVDAFVLDSGAATGYHASLFSADDDAGVTLDIVLCFSDDDITANNLVDHFVVELDEFMEKSESDDAIALRYANLFAQLILFAKLILFAQVFFAQVFDDAIALRYANLFAQLILFAQLMHRDEFSEASTLSNIGKGGFVIIDKGIVGHRDNMRGDLVAKIYLFVYLLCSNVEVIENKVNPAFCPPRKRDLIADGDEEELLMLDGGAGRSIAGEERFILDSGASVHTTGNRALLSGYTRIPTGGGHVIRVANGDPLPVRGFGALNFEDFTLNRVVHVSVSKLAELDYTGCFTRTGCDYTGCFTRTGCFIWDVDVGTTCFLDRLIDIECQLNHSLHATDIGILGVCLPVIHMPRIKPSYHVAEDYLKVFPHGVTFSITTSSKGGVVDINVGSRTIHAPKFSSAHHPVVQMVLFARHLYKDTFGCPKSVVPRGVLAMVQRSRSSASPPEPCVCQPAGLADWKTTVLACKDAHELADTEPERHRETDFAMKLISTLDGKMAMTMFVSGDTTVQAMANPAIDDGDAFVLDSGAATGYHASLCCALLMEKWESDDAIAHRHANLLPQFMHNDELERVISEKISMVSRPGNGGSGSEGAAWQSDVHHSGDDSCTVDEHGAATKTENGTEATWLMATAAPHHATGNRGLLSGFTPELGLLFVQPAGGDGAPMPIRGRGAVATGAVVLPDVWFVPGLAANLVSVSQLAGLGYSVGFARGVCSVRSDGGAVVAGEARVGEDGLFALDFLRIPLDAV